MDLESDYNLEHFYSHGVESTLIIFLFHSFFKSCLEQIAENMTSTVCHQNRTNLFPCQICIS